MARLREHRRGSITHGTVHRNFLPELLVWFNDVAEENPQKPLAGSESVMKLSQWLYSSHGERSWMGIFNSIQNTCGRAGLPKAIVMDACGMFRNIADSQKTRGETRRAMMAAAVFTSCRQNDAARSHEEVAELFNVGIRALCKALANFESEERIRCSILSWGLPNGCARRISGMCRNTDRDKVILRLHAGCPR
jgi:transcription initiation factor TFIIIB Brf1 subunit/transcription initiation factor TFIIB